MPYATIQDVYEDYQRMFDVGPLSRDQIQAAIQAADMCCEEVNDDTFWGPLSQNWLFGIEERGPWPYYFQPENVLRDVADLNEEYAKLCRLRGIPER